MLQNFNEILVISKIPFADAIKEDNFEHTTYMAANEYITWKSVYEEQEKRKQYVPVAKDKLFFHKGCNCPRYKVRDWGKKNDISITLNKNKAQAQIVPKNYIQTYLENNYIVRLDKKQFIKWININYNVEDHNIENLFKIISEYPDKYIYLSENYSRWSNRNITGYHGDKHTSLKTTIKDSVKSSYWDETMSFVTEKNWSNFSSIITNPNIYSDESLVNLINADLVIIDNVMYKNLCKIFESEDKSNHIIALESITNCNINSSLYYILMLFKNYSYVMYHMKQRNHVNFKSLLLYLDLKHAWSCMSDDKIIDVLLKKEELTMDIIKDYATRIKKEYKDRTDSQHFKINTITVSDEIKEYFINKSKPNPSLIVNTENVEIE